MKSNKNLHHPKSSHPHSPCDWIKSTYIDRIDLSHEKKHPWIGYLVAVKPTKSWEMPPGTPWLINDPRIHVIWMSKDFLEKITKLVEHQRMKLIMTYNDMFDDILIPCCLECKIQFWYNICLVIVIWIWAVDIFIGSFQEYHRISTCL